MSLPATMDARVLSLQSPKRARSSPTRAFWANAAWLLSRRRLRRRSRRAGSVSPSPTPSPMSPAVAPSSPSSPALLPYAPSSDLDFLFNAASDSDLESLPDLTDDASICSGRSAVTPVKDPTHLSLAEDIHTPGRKVLFPWAHAHLAPRPTSVTVFDIPELVHKIIEYAHHQNTVAPHEIPGRDVDPNVLFTCLQVNRLFYNVARQLLGQQLVFSRENNLYQFLRGPARTNQSFRPRACMFSRLVGAKQPAIETFAQAIDASSLERLEVFMCPKLQPTPTLFHQALKTLVVAGSRVADDVLLTQVARRCPNLEVLDLRACERVTDCGIHAIASSCRRLVSVNLGRKRKGHLITDHSTAVLFARNPRLETVGLAGCHVSDRSLWELALHAGSSVQRLSLNNCPHITDRSLPVILHHNLMRNLSVLEIRFLAGVTNVAPIVTFKRSQHARGVFLLVETCEELLARMQECERSMDTVLSKRIYQDISDWANASDDDDTAYVQFMSSRR